MDDKLSTQLDDYLYGNYDCVDRIVFNAYFQFGQTPAGFRLWWRQLEGSDDELDNNHLMRMAGRLARRLRAHANAHNIPVIDCDTKERKDTIAAEYLPKEPGFVGLFAILVGRAPAPVWNVKKTKSGKIMNIERKTQYVNHYHFHIQDPEWGHIIFRMSGHPPFGAQIILNGHEYVACRSKKEGVTFRKEDNCFTQISEPTRLAQVADTLSTSDVVGQLEQVFNRWIYSTCLCFALDLEEQERTNFHYDYSIYQAEYSRNLLFRSGGQMQQLVQALIDRTRSWLDVKQVKTIFGAARRPFRHAESRTQPRFEIVVEKPAYDLIIFKIHFGKLTVKLYTKGERVLRGEAIVHNARALHCGRSLPNFPKIILELEQILVRFFDVLDCVNSAFLDDDTFDNLSRPGKLGSKPVAGIDLSKQRLRAVLNAAIALAASPNGMTVSDLAAKVREFLGLSPQDYKPRHAAYDLKKLRGKQWVIPIGKSRRYQLTSDGIRTISALLTLREKVIRPLLAGARYDGSPSSPSRSTPLGDLYQTLQDDLQHLFQALGLAVQAA
ncbi:MAG: hypothetical protein NTW32_22870 [Chloroflexi bacterium]|nr:hypothetical protein [Chloroflexota bacterium]